MAREMYDRRDMCEKRLHSKIWTEMEDTAQNSKQDRKDSETSE